MRKDLESIALFSELDSAELSAIEPFLESRDVDAGDTVIREDVEEGRCFFVASGCLRVSSSMSELDQEEVFSFLRPGEHFGEISLIDRQPPAASVVAEEPSRLYSISHDELRRLMAAHPGLANKFLWSMLQSFCRRLRDTNQSLSFARFLMKRPGAAD